MNSTETADLAAALDALEQMFGYYEPAATPVAEEEDDYALAA